MGYNKILLPVLLFGCVSYGIRLLWLKRRQLRLQNIAAVHIQSAYRCYAAQKQYKNLLMHRHIAATRIQAAFRGYRGRKIFFGSNLKSGTTQHLLRAEAGLPPLGLLNLDNTCYLNSVMQCLTFIPPLAQYCVARSHSSTCPVGADSGVCPICLLEQHILNAHMSFEHGLQLAPAEILIYVCEARFFDWGRQEDAHEFLVLFIGACVQWEEDHQPEMNHTFLQQMFRSLKLRQVISCLSCRLESESLQLLMNITLEIKHSSSLVQSLEQNFRWEFMMGDNKYDCSRCGKFRDAETQVLFDEAPNILFIHLNRFDISEHRKIDKHITFDESLDISKHMSQNSMDPNLVYKLFGIIVHLGSSPYSGHYYAYVKDQAGCWYCCNDSTVTKCTLRKVLKAKAYILFYSKPTKEEP